MTEQESYQQQQQQHPYHYPLSSIESPNITSINSNNAHLQHHAIPSSTSLSSFSSQFHNAPYTNLNPNYDSFHNGILVYINKSYTYTIIYKYIIIYICIYKYNR